MRASRSKLLLLPFVALAWLPSAASACPVCFGNPDDPMTKSIGLGILFLLGTIGAVLAVIAGFFVFLVRRAAAQASAANSQLAAPAPKA